LMLEVIREELARILAIESSQMVDPDGRLFEMGLDSLMALELKNRLEHEFDLRLPSTLLFDHPTASLVSRYVFIELFGTVPETAAETAEPESYTNEELDRIIDEEYARVIKESNG
jgi:myxalamid-type polyketide synthase MxaC